MKSLVDESIEILERTPVVVYQLLHGLSATWISANEGENTWNAYDVIGHLIHGEKTDWMVRVEQIMSVSGDKKFRPFDRFAQFETSRGKTMDQLLAEFQEIRSANLTKLHRLNITAEDLQKTGEHPTFGTVTLAQLLSTWVVHDLDHIGQISRVMAKRYQNEVGPWIAFLKILRQ